MGRIFEEMADSERHNARPAVSIWEDDWNYDFAFAALGVQAENVNVNVVEGVLTLASKRQSSEQRDCLRLTSRT